MATKFYASTANQLNELYASKDATELDLEELIRVNIDWLSIKTQLKREMYPAKKILEDSLELIELSELASDEIRLYAIANHCRFKLLLEGRAGARNSADWLDKGFQLGNQVRPNTRQERRLAARSSLCLAMVRYKGGLGSEPFAKWFDRSLELYESLFDQDTASNLSLNREYAAAINASTMPKVILLNQAIAKAADESEMTSAMEFSKQIEKDYKQASTLLANIAKTDPMNNRVLRSRVSSEWMLADFYCFQRENGMVANSNNERTHRQQCISLLQELEKRQPQEVNSRQGQALQWFRLGRSHLIEQENEAALNCFEKLLQIDGWWQMNTFELADMVQTTHALAWYCDQRDRTLGIDAVAFKQMLENQQTRLASFSEVVGKKFKVSVKGYWPILTSDSLNLFGDSYSECGPEWNRYLEVIEYQDN